MGKCHMIPVQDFRIRSLRKRKDFVGMRSGRRQHSTSFVLQMREHRCNKVAGNGVRVGYTVTKKIGNAVERNRIKRRMRAVVARAMPTGARQAHDYVLICKRTALSADFDTMVAELGTSLNRVHRNTNKSGNQNGK